MPTTPLNEIVPVLQVAMIFIACMTALFASLVAFICDINLALHALKLELKGIPPGPG